MAIREVFASIIPSVLSFFRINLYIGIIFSGLIGDFADLAFKPGYRPLVVPTAREPGISGHGVSQ